MIGGHSAPDSPCPEAMMAMARPRRRSNQRVAFATSGAIIEYRKAQGWNPPEPGEAPSGEEGEDQQLDEHAELGDQLRIVMILFAGAIVLLVAADQARRRGTEGPIGRAATALASRRIDLALKAAVGILAAVAIVWVVRTGHEGAKVAWSEEPGFGNQDSPPAGVAPPYGEPGE